MTFRRAHDRRFQGRRGTVAPADIYQTLGASGAWRATSVSSSGGNTTAWLPIVGSVSLLPTGTTQLQPATNAALNNRLAVPFAGTGEYTGTITAPGNSHTLVWVGQVTPNVNGGCVCLCSGTTANTGTSLFYQITTDGFRARRIATADAFQAISAPIAAIVVATYTQAAATVRVNTTTATTLNGATAVFSQSGVVLGGVGSNALRLQGAIAEAGVFPSVLSNGDIATLMADRAAFYGITLT